MKITPARWILAIGATCLVGFQLVAQEPASTKANPPTPTIPGSAVEPPKTLTSPLPAPAKETHCGVKVGVWIKEDGSVEDTEFIAGSRDWFETVRTAVKAWRFEPVVWQGKALPARAEVGFVQESPKKISWSALPLPNLPGEIHAEGEFGLKNPVIESDQDLILPLITRSRAMLSIGVVISYVVEPDGTTDKIEVTQATSEGAIRSALDVISTRTYKPAQVRGVPVAYQCQQVINFQSMAGPIAALAGAEDLCEPAYPYERLLADEEGYAVVSFTLGEDGRVVSVKEVEASHPDFSGALVAAIEGWKFSAESAAAQPTREYRHDFSISGVPYSMRRLATGAKAGKMTPNSPAGLDAKPKLLARPGLVYPTKLYEERVAGSAEIEFVIDRVGLAQLPHVLKASRPEFGWAAANAVNGMRFASLTKGDIPTELRVRLPMRFDPPQAK